MKRVKDFFDHQQRRKRMQRMPATFQAPRRANIHTAISSLELPPFAGSAPSCSSSSLTSAFKS